MVSEGIAVGRVLRLHADARQQVYRAVLQEADLGPEVRRFRAALRLAQRQLRAIKKRAERALGADHAYIFDAHILMLQDRKLREDVEAHIRRERSNAEWAVKVITDQLRAVYAKIKDDYLRARSSDIEDVTRRVLFALSVEQPINPRALPETRSSSRKIDGLVGGGTGFLARARNRLGRRRVDFSHAIIARGLASRLSSGCAFYRARAHGRRGRR